MAFIDAVSNQTVTAQLQNANCVRRHVIGAPFPTLRRRLITEPSASAHEAPVSRLQAKRRRKVTDGPPKKRNPTLAGNKRRADRNHRKSQRETNNTKARTKPQDAERRFLWVTSGSRNIGFIEQIGDSYNAIAADERALGVFGSLTAALDAVSAAHEGVL
jgi:hypothetical protein